MLLLWAILANDIRHPLYIFKNQEIYIHTQYMFIEAHTNVFIFILQRNLKIKTAYCLFKVTNIT